MQQQYAIVGGRSGFGHALLQALDADVLGEVRVAPTGRGGVLGDELDEVGLESDEVLSEGEAVGTHRAGPESSSSTARVGSRGGTLTSTR